MQLLRLQCCRCFDNENFPRRQIPTHNTNARALADDEESEDNGMGEVDASMIIYRSGVFSPVLETPEETWDKLWETVKAALVHSGYKGKAMVKRVHRVRKMNY